MESGSVAGSKESGDTAERFQYMQYRSLVFAITAALIHFVGLAFHDVQAQQCGEESNEQPPVGKWTVVGEMHEQREYAGGVRLQDGRVLAVSGHPLAGKSIASAELYDPKTARWSETGSLGEARNSGNQATLLVDGQVLVAGGHTNAHVIRGAELFDPATGTWSDAGMLAVPRDPIATLLADGRVLVAGGINWYIGGGKMYADCELFDPATGKWTATGSLSMPRNAQRMLRLDDDRVLAIGGYGPGTNRSPVPNCTTRQPGLAANGRDASASGLVRTHKTARRPGASGRRIHRRQQQANVLEEYDGLRPADWALQRVDSDGAKTRRIRDCTADRRAVLVCGGVAEAGLEMKGTELFDPQTETWQVVAPMNLARRNHRASVMPDGSVLVIGGRNFGGDNYLSSCEIFSPF